MDSTSKITKLQKLIIQLLCNTTIPKEAFPHTVFVEEEDKQGNPTYSRYRLISINPKDETCILSDNTGQENTFNLTDINIEWLAVILDRCNELMPSKKKKLSESISDKELWVFLYPISRFQRNTPDWKIIAGYEKYHDKTPEVIKLRPDEFAERINDDMFNDLEYYVRFIELPINH